MGRPKLVTFSFEVPVREKLYEQSPVRIINDFLVCVDDDGKQVFEFPPHVIKALAERLRRVVGTNRTLNSLDDAFGGKIARQRNALEEEEKTGEIVFEQIMAMKTARSRPKSERSGTPYEVAAEEVAASAGVSDESVKRRYKKAGKR